MEGNNAERERYRKTTRWSCPRPFVDGLEDAFVLQSYCCWGRHTMCDGCEMSPLVGRRYKCTTMENFDLCEACHTRREEIVPNQEFKKVFCISIVEQVKSKGSGKQPKRERRVLQFLRVPSSWKTMMKPGYTD